MTCGHHRQKINMDLPHRQNRQQICLLCDVHIDSELDRRFFTTQERHWIGFFRLIFQNIVSHLSPQVFVARLLFLTYFVFTVPFQ
jgi:hypothetical protein